MLGGILLGCVSAFANETPMFYSETFSEMGMHNDFVAAPWVTYGNGATPIESVKSFFTDSKNQLHDFIILNYGDTYSPMCCTNFTPSTAADQWLVSPEIEIPADDVELGFTATCYCNFGAWGSGAATYKILVSESGVEKDCFSETPLYEGNVVSSSIKEINEKTQYIPVKGYGGKKVHLAFVVTAENVGMVGFTNIVMGTYALTVDNLTPEAVKKGDEVVISYNLGMKTPVSCPGVKAVLSTSYGIKEELYLKKNLGTTSTSLAYVKPEFSPILLDRDESLEYTVTITPDYEEAPSSELIGTVGVPNKMYINNCVIEEVTATGCQACPSGMAGMEYYADKYPGSETQGKAIGIAIHGFINHTDPMSEGVSEYLVNTMSLNGTTTYPQAIANRLSRGLMPAATQFSNFVDKEVNRTTYNKASITNIKAPSADNCWGQPMTVDFGVKNSYDAKGRLLNAAVVLIEDKVRGNDRNYSQTNGFYNRGADYFTSYYDPDILPYVRKYLQGGELGQETIPFEKMEYNHVARLIYPSYYGMELSESYKADEYENFSLTFNVPETIIDFKNTKVIVIVTNRETKEIVAAEEADVFGFSGIQNVAESQNASVVKVGDNIEVSGEGNLKIEIYSIDGRLLRSAAGNGNVVVGIDGLNGGAIVKVSDANGIAVRKIMM